MSASLLSPNSYAIGTIVVATPAAPGAGVNPTVTVPGGKLWRLRAWTGTLTTSGVAGNRQPFIRAQTAAAVAYARAAQSLVTAAGGVSNYTFALGLSNPATSPNPGQAGLWDLYLLPGHQFAITALAFDPGDAWTNIAYSVEEWLLTP